MGELLQSFRSYLDARLWRNARLMTRFFCHIAPLGLVTTESLYSLLNAFASVLEEAAVALVRADRAGVTLVESICFAGHDLVETDTEALEQLNGLVQRLQAYGDARKVNDGLLRPWVPSDELASLSLAVSLIDPSRAPTLS